MPQRVGTYITTVRGRPRSPYLNHLLEVAMLVAEATGEHRGVMSTISRTDAMSEYQRDQAIAEFVDREHSRRILRLVDAKLRELAEEVADLLREENSDAQDFESLWEAICYYVAKGKRDDLNKYEEPIHAMCRQALQECYGDRFTAQVLAAIMTQCDEFYQKAGRRDEPSSQSLDEWTAKAIYARLLDLRPKDTGPSHCLPAFSHSDGRQRLEPGSDRTRHRGNRVIRKRQTSRLKCRYRMRFSGWRCRI
jgi:hypothetical protein